MRAKNLLVSILAMVAVALALTATVSASDLNISESDIQVWINGISAGNHQTMVVYPGETISVKVGFRADVVPGSDSCSTVSTDACAPVDDVQIEAELEGYGHNVDDEAFVGKVYDGGYYTKTLSLKVPYDLKDELSDKATLVVRVSNDNSVERSINLIVERNPFDANIMSISTVQTVEAGQMLPVDVVIKNKGGESLDDLYVSASIPALGVTRTAYFGDLVALENCEDDCDEEDTVSGRIYLQLPDNAKSGVYTIEVKASNDDTSASAVQQVTVVNELSTNNIIASVTGRTVAVGEKADYTILIVNPTSKLQVYKVIPEVADGVSVSVSDPVVAVPAGSSKTVTVTANAAAEGKYNFNVNVFSGDVLLQKVPMNADVTGSKLSTTSPAMVLTIVLAVVFIILLIVLVTLLGRKPSKSEEFGESYY